MIDFSFESSIIRDDVEIEIVVYCNLDDALRPEDITAERSDDCQDVVLSTSEEEDLASEVPNAYYDAHNPRY